jgi:AcrR family transcriptional regulator
MDSAVKRPLSLRSEQAARTRHRILEAAESVFTEQGFAGTRIEDIAVAAGVAVPTVYKIFTSKKNILVGVLNMAMTGGADAEVDTQAWWREQLDEPDPRRQLQLIARNARRIYERAAPMLEAVRAAAPLDPEIARTWEEISAERLKRSKRSAKALVAKARRRTRMNIEETALTLLTLTVPELYTSQLATGRSPDQYERWLASVLVSSLLGN